MYKVKIKSDGSIERYKVRLIAKGYTQREGFDFTKTFSPVAKHTTVRTFLAVAVAQGWFLSQLKVHNAFLNGDLNEHVYMDIPLGYTVQGEYGVNSKLVSKLQNSLYGLKWASRQWNVKFTQCLIVEGFSQSKSNYSFFTKHVNKSFIVVLVYMNDIIVSSNDKWLVNQFKNCLSSHFKLKYLGTL